MAQIINAPVSLGQRLGVGLGEGLQQLAQMKMQQLQQRQAQNRTVQGLEALGFSPEKAQSASGLDPKLLGHIVKEHVRAKESKSRTSAGIRAIVPGLSQQEADDIAELPPSLQAAWYRNIVGDLSSAQQENGQLPEGGLFEQQPQEANPLEQQPSQQEPIDILSLLQGGNKSGNPDIGSIIAQQNKPALINANEPSSVNKLKPNEEKRAEHIAKKDAEKRDKELKREEAQNRKQNLTERALSEKSAREAKKAEAQETKEKFKFNKDLREKIVNDHQSARSVLSDLNRIEELNQEGKLDTPGYVEFLKRSGLDIPALMNPESEEFQKIVQNFTKDAKTYFGGRVSNFEVEQFLKTVPSLSQSPEGRKRVMANLKRLAQAKVEYYKTYKEILKENKGVPPYGLLEELEDRMEDRYEKLSDAFRKDLEKEVPKGQNRIITALQATLGDIVGSSGGTIGKTLKGAVKGAALGRFAGPAGLVPGAIGGAIGGLTGFL